MTSQYVVVMQLLWHFMVVKVSKSTDAKFDAPMTFCLIIKHESTSQPPRPEYNGIKFNYKKILLSV